MPSTTKSTCGQGEGAADHPGRQDQAGVGKQICDGSRGEEDPRADHAGHDQQGGVAEMKLSFQPIARVSVGSGLRHCGPPSPTGAQERNGMISRATMLMTLSIGLMAGPAVSL